MLRSRRLTLAHSLRDFSLREPGPITLSLGKVRASLWPFVCLLMDRKQKTTDWKKAGQDIAPEDIPLVSFSRAHL